MASGSTAVYTLAGFSESERRTLRLIADYLSERSGQRCFTYRGLRRYWDRRRLYSLEWHTAERAVRRLAEAKWLVRVRRGRRVIFCLGERLELLLGELGWLKNSG